MIDVPVLHIGADLAMDSRLHSRIQTESVRCMETEDMKRVEGMFARETCRGKREDGRSKGMQGSSLEANQLCRTTSEGI